MKKLTVLTVLAFLCFHSLQAQRSVEYLEVRTYPWKGLMFRTAPSMPMQRIGLFGSNMTIIFSQDEEANLEFSRFKTKRLIFTGTYIVAAPLYLVGVVNLMGFNNSELLGAVQVLGSASLVLTGAILYNSSFKNLYQAIDLYNLNHNAKTTFQEMQPFIPQIQPSSQSLGLGLVWAIK